MGQARKSYKKYKSPVRKLVHFFEESRDKWKDPILLEQKFGWLRAFRHDIAEWRQLLSDVVTTEIFVRQDGLYHGTSQAVFDNIKARQLTR